MRITKYVAISIALLICISCFGCVSVHRYINTDYEPTYLNEIEIFSTVAPKRPYIEIAQIILKSRINEKTINRLKEEAAQLGADAIILLGPAKMGGFNGGLTKIISGAIGWTFGAYLNEEIGWKTVAIKYIED
jgi:hypothetical protein